jgi:hypothetical protein
MSNKYFHNQPPFQKGDRVTTMYHRYQGDIVREVLECGADRNYGSGWYVAANGGDMCPCCRRIPGEPIHKADSAWFTFAP